jgi:phage tail-like protein
MECKLPSLQIETLEVKEGGQNNYTHQLPVRLKSGSLTLRHGITKSDALMKWYMDVLRGMTTGNMQSIMHPVTITMFTVQRATLATFSLQNAFPKKWAGPTLKADDKAIAVEELELAFSEFTVE